MNNIDKLYKEALRSKKTATSGDLVQVSDNEWDFHWDSQPEMSYGYIESTPEGFQWSAGEAGAFAKEPFTKGLSGSLEEAQTALSEVVGTLPNYDEYYTRQELEDE